VRIGSMVSGCYDHQSGTVRDDPRFGGVHQHPADSTPLMTVRHRQRHDLTARFVALVKEADTSSNETHNVRILTCDQSCVVVVAADRIEPLSHLAGCCWIAQRGNEPSYRLRIGDRSVADRDPCHNPTTYGAAVGATHIVKLANRTHVAKITQRCLRFRRISTTPLVT
jgi:hypothetical protein